MRFFDGAKNRALYILYCVLGFLLPLLYVLAVRLDWLHGWLSFLQPSVVGAMPLFLQFILLDILFFFALKGEGEYTAVLYFIAALLLCDFAVRAGWFVFGAVVIAAVSAVITPKKAGIMLPVRAVALILVYSLS